LGAVDPLVALCPGQTLWPLGPLSTRPGNTLSALHTCCALDTRGPRRAWYTLCAVTTSTALRSGHPCRAAQTGQPDETTRPGSPGHTGRCETWRTLRARHTCDWQRGQPEDVPNRGDTAGFVRVTNVRALDAGL
jgi:hypothetical protein